MPQQQPKKSPEERKQSAIRATAKYGGMALQLFGSCLAGVFIGKWIDSALHLSRPTFAVFLTIIFLFAAFYLIYKQLLED